MSKAGAGDLIPVSKKMKRDPPGEGLGLGDLPELALLEIAKHLELQDLLHLSIASSRIWRLVGTKSVLWSKLLQCMNITVSPRLEVLASRFSTLFPSSCEEKRRLMVFKKTRNNWKSGNISQVWTHYAYVFATQNDILLFGRDDDGDNGPDYTTLPGTSPSPDPKLLRTGPIIRSQAACLSHQASSSSSSRTRSVSSSSKKPKTRCKL